MDKLEKAKRLKDMLSQIAGRQGLEFDRSGERQSRTVRRAREP